MSIISGTAVLMNKGKHIKSKKITEAHSRATVNFSGLFKALAQRTWHSTPVEVDPDSREAIQINRIAKTEEVAESLKSRVHINQPVLDYLKDK